MTSDRMECTTCLERSPTLEVLGFEVETQAFATAGHVGFRSPHARCAHHLAFDATGRGLDVRQGHRHRQETRTWTAAAHADAGLDGVARRRGRCRAQNHGATVRTWSALRTAERRAVERGLQLRAVCSHRPWLARRRGRGDRRIGVAWIGHPNVQEMQRGLETSVHASLFDMQPLCAFHGSPLHLGSQLHRTQELPVLPTLPLLGVRRNRLRRYRDGKSPLLPSRDNHARSHATCPDVRTGNDPGCGRGMPATLAALLRIHGTKHHRFNRVRAHKTGCPGIWRNISQPIRQRLGEEFPAGLQREWEVLVGSVVPSLPAWAKREGQFLR
eukprot:scaffold283_cov316-Pavlova_lutheri.AAC.4